MRKIKIFIGILVIIILAGLAWLMADYRDNKNNEPLIIINNKQELKYKNITSDDLSAMLENKDFTLIDVHIPEQSHIPGTDSFIPFNEIDKNIERLPSDKNAKIVLYCRSGSMSQAASEELLDLGYTDVYNLAGGLNDWKKQGYSVEEASLLKN